MELRQLTDAKQSCSSHKSGCSGHQSSDKLLLQNILYFQTYFMITDMLYIYIFDMDNMFLTTSAQPVVLVYHYQQLIASGHSIFCVIFVLRVLSLYTYIFSTRSYYLPCKTSYNMPFNYLLPTETTLNLRMESILQRIIYF